MCTIGATVHVNLAAVKLIGSLDQHKPLSYVATQYKHTYTCTYTYMYIIAIHIYTHVCTNKPMHITHMMCMQIADIATHILL